MFVPKKVWPVAVELVAKCQATMRAELGTAEPGLNLTLTETRGAKRRSVFKKAVQKKLLQTIVGAAARRHQDERRHPRPGRDLDQRGHDQATAKTIELVTSQRSSVASEIDGDLRHRAGRSSSWAAPR